MAFSSRSYFDGDGKEHDGFVLEQVKAIDRELDHHRAIISHLMDNQKRLLNLPLKSPASMKTPLCFEDSSNQRIQADLKRIIQKQLICSLERDELNTVLEFLNLMQDDEESKSKDGSEAYSADLPTVVKLFLIISRMKDAPIDLLQKIISKGIFA